MKTWEILQAARDRIADRPSWTRGVCYGIRTIGRGGEWRNSGYYPEMKLEEANCFCSVGTVCAQLGIPKNGLIGLNSLVMEDWVRERFGASFSRCMRYLNAALKQVNNPHNSTSVWGFNDGAEHEQVLELFDTAIKNAKRRHANGRRYKSA